MILEESILDELTGKKFASDALVFRFKNLAGKFYPIETQPNIEFMHKFKEAARFYRFPLTYDFNEYFIRFEDASHFLLYDTPFTTNYLAYFKETGTKRFPGEAHRSLMDFYSKWVTLKSVSDKKFFAGSMINIITKNLAPEYFLSRIIYGIILIYDQYFFDPIHAREVLKDAEESMEQGQIDPVLKNDYKYLIKLYTGFSYLAQRDPANAFQIFSDAAILKANGITAKFYLLLSSIQKNENDNSPILIKDIFLYDVERLNYAIDSNNLPMFQYFLKFPVCANLFKSDDFTPLLRVIEELIETNKKYDEVSVESLKNKLVFLSQLKLNSFFNEEIISSILFLESIVQKYTGNSTTLFNAVLPKLSNKIISVANEIRNNIAAYYNSEIAAKLSGVEQKVEMHQNKIEILKKEFDELKLQTKVKLEKSILIIETNAAAFIAQAEAQINSLSGNTKLNPLLSFKTSMVYNVIASILVFLVGGIAGYTNIEYAVGSEFKDLMSGVILQGLKWTIITFLLGSLISVLKAGFVLLDKSNYKHKHIQQISAIKNDKDRQLIALRENSKNRDKLLQDALKESIDHENKKISKLQKDMEDIKKTLFEEADIKISEEVKRLQPLFSI